MRRGPLLLPLFPKVRVVWAVLSYPEAMSWGFYKLLSTSRRMTGESSPPGWVTIPIRILGDKYEMEVTKR